MPIPPTYALRIANRVLGLDETTTRSMLDMPISAPNDRHRNLDDLLAVMK
jgi:hypothetical protein